MTEKEVQESDVGRRMDAMPLTMLHLLAISLCTVGFGFDLFEISLGSVLATVFSSADKSLSVAGMTWLLASVYVGAVVGAPLLGRLADRVGRRAVLSGALLWLSVMSLWAALTKDFTQLVTARGLSGIALGAYPPLMMSYLADVLPARRRGPIVMWVCGLAGFGLPAGVFFVRGLGSLEPLGLEPWRWAFILGASGAGLLGLLTLGLPESPRWLQSKGRNSAAIATCDRFATARVIWKAPSISQEVPASAKEASAATRPSPRIAPWSRIGPLFFLSPFATVAFPMLMGMILSLRGFVLADALLFVGLSTFGPALGSIATSFVVDRVERRTALCTCVALMIATSVVFVGADSRAMIGASAVLFGMASLLYTSCINLYAAELFPTHARASSVSIAWSINRVGAATSLFLLLPLLKQHGAMVLVGLIVMSLILSLLLLLASPKGLARQPVA